MKIIWHHWLTVAALLGGLSTATTANAATVPAKDNVYHVTSAKQTTWLWNKAHTKKLAAINQMDSKYDQQAWLVAGQTTLTTNGKKAVYYHVTNARKAISGYVWRGHLTKGYPAVYRLSEPAGYYRLDADTAITFDHNQHATLPKGTIVFGNPNLENRKWQFSIDLEQLSYTLKHQLGIDTPNGSAADQLDLKALQMTPVTEPAYILPQLQIHGQSYWPTGLYPAANKGKNNTQLTRFTADGYLEFYNNGKPQNFGRVNGKPISQKILNVQDTGKQRTVIYGKAIPGLPGQPTTYQGKPALQLTVSLNPKVEPGDGDGLMRYQVNGQPYLQWLSFEPLTPKGPDPVKNLTDQEFVHSDHMYYNHDKFYRAKRTVKLKVAYSTYYGIDHFFKTITIPQGTVVAADQYNKNPLQIMSDRLSSHLVKPIYDKGFYVSYTHNDAQANPRDFQRVKRPNYLPAWSAGDLYLGANQAILHSTTKRSALSLQITPNGYVEVHRNPSNGPITTYRARPTQSVKIQRTVVKHHTRYLYLAKPLKGFKTTKVTTRGKTQYRFALTNQHKYRYSVGEENNTFYALYSAGGKTFYTTLGTTHD